MALGSKPAISGAFGIVSAVTPLIMPTIPIWAALLAYAVAAVLFVYGLVEYVRENGSPFSNRIAVDEVLLITGVAMRSEANAGGHEAFRTAVITLENHGDYIRSCSVLVEKIVYRGQTTRIAEPLSGSGGKHEFQLESGASAIIPLAGQDLRNGEHSPFRLGTRSQPVLPKGREYVIYLSARAGKGRPAKRRVRFNITDKNRAEAKLLLGND